MKNESKQKKSLPIPEHFPNPLMPTLRITSVQCEVDGGAFLLVLSDLRPVKPYTIDPLTRFEGNSAFQEMGRFAFSPVTFCYLKQAMAQAEEFYCKYFGPLPDTAKLLKQFESDAPDLPSEVEHRMGFRAEISSKEE